MGYCKGWLIVAICIILAGCTRGGSVRGMEMEVKAGENGGATVKTEQVEISLEPGASYTLREGTAQQPTPPRTPAEWKSSGLWLITGEAMERLQSLEGSFWLIIAGVLMAAFGLGIMLAKKAGSAHPVVKAMPRGFGRAMLIMGGVLMAWPFFLERYGWLLAVGAVGIMIVFAWKWWINQKNINQK